MAENSKIGWCDHTFNPWMGCTKVGPGCDHCYAEALVADRYHWTTWGAGQPRKRTSPANWKKPLAWDRRAGRFRPKVFCASLADVFDNEVPVEWREDLFALIRATPNLDWLLLTKRIGNAQDMLPRDWGGGWPNVWLGATVVNQAEADRDIRKLLCLPARVRFLSLEPLLGPIQFPLPCRDSLFWGGIRWFIVGGESGLKARPMEEAWALSIARQCAAAAVYSGARPAMFMKQGSAANWPHWKPDTFYRWPRELRVRQFPRI